MEIVTGEEMRRIDRRAIDGLGIPSPQLMEAAGRGVAEALLRDWPDARERGVVVLCGKGNNGGDGLVAARRLVELGLRPRVFLVGRAAEVSADAAQKLISARSHGVVVDEVPDAASWGELRQTLRGGPIVLDALLGTGVRGGVRGVLAELIELVRASDCPVASVDVPSGLDADSIAVPGLVLRAQRTYTLCRPKLPLVFLPAARYAGSWTVVPIGIPDEAVAAEGVLLDWFDAAAAAGLVASRESDAHKGRYGHLLAVAGSRSKSGAAVLLARGALRCGVGLITVATPRSAQPLVAVQQAEIMTEGLPETASGGLEAGAVGPLRELISARDALAIGPGLGLARETRAAVRAILAECAKPAVVDADGLNALAPLDGPVATAGGAARALTPHPGEAARLLATTTGAVQADRLGAARDLARRAQAIVVLKGHRSLTAHPDGRVAVNSSGNPGLASGGTGDVLAGAVGALLARGLDGWDAARLATYVHGVAGDLAAGDRGQDGMIASDVIACLPRALASLIAMRQART